MEKPDFKKEFLTKYLGASSEARKDHYRAAPLPFFEPMEYAEWLNSLAAGGHSMPSHFGYACLPDEDPSAYHSWTMFFMHLTQGGQYDGSGILVRYSSGIYNQQNRTMILKPVVGRFWICKHERVDEPGANHSRGWHPAHCKLCGLDMTVDSGD